MTYPAEKTLLPIQLRHLTISLWPGMWIPECTHTHTHNTQHTQHTHSHTHSHRHDTVALSTTVYLQVQNVSQLETSLKLVLQAQGHGRNKTTKLWKQRKTATTGLRVQAWKSGSKWGDGGRKQEVLTTPESQGLMQVTPLEVSEAVPLSREGQDSIGTQPHGSVHARGEVDTKERKSWIWNLGMNQ